MEARSHRARIEQRSAVLKRYVRRAYGPIERLQPPASRTESPIFVVGCPHSGTTLLARLLDLHPNIYTVRYESQLFKLPVRRATARRAFRGWSDAASAIGKNRVCEKTPRQVYCIDRLLHHFPNARIVIITRDGRDVVASLGRRGYSVASASRLWTNAVSATLATDNDERVVSLRYEAMVDDPARLLAGLCGTLDEIDASDDMLARYATTPFAMGWDGPIPEQPPKEVSESRDHSALRTWQVNQPIYDSSGRWRRELSAEDLATFDRVAGDTLRSLGYV